MIAAILRAQFLSMRMFRAAGGARGTVFAAITAVVWYGMWTVVAWGVFAAVEGAPLPGLAAALPIGFLAVMIYWQVVPALTANFGATLDLRKLLLYPVPHRKLFAVELMLRLTTVGEMLLVLAGGALGLFANRYLGTAAGLRAAAAMGLFVAFNVLLASGLRSLLERLLSRRHVREAVILLFVLVTALPRLLLASGVKWRSLVPYFNDVATPGWPWSAAASMALGESVLAAVGSVCAWIVLAGVFGRWQFERSLRFDASAAQATATPERLRDERSWSLWLPDPLGAIVEKELRSLARTPRFRMVFVMGFTFGILVWLPIVMGRGGAAHGPVALNFLAIVSVYALTLLGQVSYWNAFGFDRSAAQLWFVSPVPVSRTLAGKNLAALVYIYLEVLAVIAAALLFHVRVPPERVLETLLVVAIAALYMLGLGNLSSVHYPRGMNPQRVSQTSASGRFQALIFVFYPVALLPVFLAYLARYAFESELAFYLVLAVAAMIGGAVYVIGTQSAAQTAGRRRELIIQELSRGQGPAE